MQDSEIGSEGDLDDNMSFNCSETSAAASKVFGVKTLRLLMMALRSGSLATGGNELPDVVNVTDATLD